MNISGGQAANFATGVPGQEKSSKSSGQYANLQSYLEANQTQAEDMGSKIASGVESKGADAQSKVNAFDSQKQSVAAFDPNSIIGKSNISDEDKQVYQSQKATGGYSGPEYVDQASGYQEAQAAATKAAAAAQQAGNEVGQQALLKETYARPDYSKGQVNLDQVLMKGSAKAKEQLEGVSGKYSQLENMFGNKALEVGESINSAKQQALANRKAFNPAETAAWDNLKNPLQARAEQMNQQNPLAYQAAFDDAADEKLSADTLQRLGLSEGQSLYDINLQSYLNPNQTQLGINDVANADERARYKALADLFQDPTRSELGDKGLDTSALKFDKKKFDSDFAAKDTAYKNAYANQRGVVDMSFEGGDWLGSPFVGPVANQIAQGLRTATPQELESYWLPYLQSLDPNNRNGGEGIGDFTGPTINAVQSAINNFKNTYKTSRQIGVE